MTVSLEHTEDHLPPFEPKIRTDISLLLFVIKALKTQKEFMGILSDN